jgi:hypothetical protein
MAAQLSIIDLSDFDARRPEITAELVHAATREGFMYITGHGISEVESYVILPWCQDGCRFASWYTSRDPHDAGIK